LSDNTFCTPESGRKKALANAKEGKPKCSGSNLESNTQNNAILCFRPEKALQSGISRVLIDDNSQNIREWEEAGEQESCTKV
jgi:hypothetical protein